MDFELDPSEAEVSNQESVFRIALREGRHDEALKIAERGVGDPETLDWEVTDMLEAIGLSLAAAGKYDESIATFERAIELDWGVVPDGRCEIARVLLEGERIRPGRSSLARHLHAGRRASVPRRTVLAAGPQRAMLVRERTQVQALLRRGFKRR